MFHSRRSDGSKRKAGGPRGRIWVLAIILLVSLPRLAWADESPHGWRGSLNVRQLFEAGGVVGVVLAALSVAMVALVIEHLFSLRARVVNPRKLAEQVHQLMHERHFKIAAKLCRDDGSLLGFVLAAGLTEIGSGYALVEKAMEDACAQYAARLYRKIDSLSVIGTLAPMLGLLGTVWGMMIAFSAFASKANVQVTELAPGISTALVTTLMGLAVAIPAYAAFAYFRNRVDEAVSTCSQMADHLFLDYRRAQAAKRRKARSASDYGRPTFPSVAIEREKSA